MTDVNGDGRADLVTAPGAGGTGRIRVWQGDNLTPLDDFFAFDATYTGGVFVG